MPADLSQAVVDDRRRCTEKLSLVPRQTCAVNLQKPGELCLSSFSSSGSNQLGLGSRQHQQECVITALKVQLLHTFFVLPLHGYLPQRTAGMALSPNRDPFTSIDGLQSRMLKGGVRAQEPHDPARATAYECQLGLRPRVVNGEGQAAPANSRTPRNRASTRADRLNVSR